jgi:hypothetical protein
MHSKFLFDMIFCVLLIEISAFRAGLTEQCFFGGPIISKLDICIISRTVAIGADDTSVGFALSLYEAHLVFCELITTIAFALF